MYERQEGDPEGKLIIVVSLMLPTNGQRYINLYFPTGVCLID